MITWLQRAVAAPAGGRREWAAQILRRAAELYLNRHPGDRERRALYLMLRLLEGLDVPAMTPADLNEITSSARCRSRSHGWGTGPVPAR